MGEQRRVVPLAGGAFALGLQPPGQQKDPGQQVTKARRERGAPGRTNYRQLGSHIIELK